MVPFEPHHISFSILKLLYLRHNHSGTHFPLPLFWKFFTSVQSSLHHISLLRPTPIAVRSNEKVRGRSTAGIAVRISLKARMLVFCVCCVGSGLCDELNTRSEESYRVCVIIVWDLETSTMRWTRPACVRTPCAEDLTSNIWLEVKTFRCKRY
jgi:hypothetical protein